MAEHNPSRYDDASASAATAGPALAETRQTATMMRAEGRTDEAFEFLFSALGAVLRTSRGLELLVARLRRAGRRSERMDPEQLALLFEELIAQLGPESAALDPDADAPADAGPAPGDRRTRRRAGLHPSRSSRRLRVGGPMRAMLLLVAGLSLAAAACTGETPTASPHDASGLTTPTPARERVAPDLDAVPPVDTTAHTVGLEDVVFDTFDGGFVSLSRAEPSPIRRLRDALRPVSHPGYDTPG